MSGARMELVLPAAPASARAGRTAVREHLVASGATDGLVEAAVLVASELVTNAVRHSGGGGLVLLLEADADHAAVGVRDESASHPSQVEPYEGGGRGMLVVGALAQRWHVQEVPGGKVVWAHLRADGSPA